MAAWTVLLQPQLPETPAEVAAAASGAEFVPPPPELATIVLGAEGMFRIYKDAKLWRTYDGTQLVAIESTEKAEHGMGIGTAAALTLHATQPATKLLEFTISRFPVLFSLPMRVCRQTMAHVGRSAHRIQVAPRHFRHSGSNGRRVCTLPFLHGHRRGVFEFTASFEIDPA